MTHRLVRVSTLETKSETLLGQIQFPHLLLFSFWKIRLSKLFPFSYGDGQFRTFLYRFLSLVNWFAFFSVFTLLNTLWNGVCEACLQSHIISHPYSRDSPVLPENRLFLVLPVLLLFFYLCQFMILEAPCLDRNVLLLTHLFNYFPKSSSDGQSLTMKSSSINAPDTH